MRKRYRETLPASRFSLARLRRRAAPAANADRRSEKGAHGDAFRHRIVSRLPQLVVGLRIFGDSPLVSISIAKERLMRVFRGRLSSLYFVIALIAVVSLI